MTQSAHERLLEGVETLHLTVESIIETYAGRLIERVPHQDIPEIIEERDILLAWWAEHGLAAAEARSVARVAEQLDNTIMGLPERGRPTDYRDGWLDALSAVRDLLAPSATETEETE